MAKVNEYSSRELVTAFSNSDQILKKNATSGEIEKIAIESLVGNYVARSSDPADPTDGKSVIWLSDGTGSGDEGDMMIKITVGETTKTITLVDYSAS